LAIVPLFTFTLPSSGFAFHKVQPVIDLVTFACLWMPKYSFAVYRLVRM
jgi:hypothetical protein